MLCTSVLTVMERRDDEFDVDELERVRSVNIAVSWRRYSYDCFVQAKRLETITQLNNNTCNSTFVFVHAF